MWAEVDAQAQAVFQNGESLKGFLDFMAQCNTQKTPNLLLIYGQNPQATVVKSYDYWKKEHRSPKVGVHGYTYMVSTEYEKDGERRTGYTISKGFDISQMSGKPLEERPQRSMEELIHAVLKDQPVQMQIADNLPEGIQAQYIPKQRTVYVQNGMEENTTFHAVNRELACAALDQHDGNYVRKKVNAQAYCAAYVIGKRYGVEVSGFQFGKIAEMQANGQKDPQELRGFLNDVRQAAYTIRNHMERNFGEQEQTFSKDDFSFEEPPKQTPKKEKKRETAGAVSSEKSSAVGIAIAGFLWYVGCNKGGAKDGRLLFENRQYHEKYVHGGIKRRTGSPKSDGKGSSGYRSHAAESPGL
mgnify:FL=1